MHLTLQLTAAFTTVAVILIMLIVAHLLAVPIVRKAERVAMESMAIALLRAKLTKKNMLKK